ncbi:hypothetical protein [Rhodosalinus sp. K401]|uniref:hypothetical protein n=1 Tax=Rhodosalinus sp. K401 TaxID=3239195 RepID=UPI0035237CB6
MNTPPKAQDVFPSLNEAFARRVQADLYKRFGDEAPTIAWEDWCALKPDLAKYKDHAEYSRGFLNKGQAEKLRKIARSSWTLRKVIDDACEEGLELIVSESVEPTGLEEFRDGLTRLAHELDLGEKIAPDFEDTTTRELTTKRELFASFEMWWTRVSGLDARIAEGWQGETHPTPFMFVANEVFNLPQLPGPIGASYKSLKDLRRADRQKKAQFKRLAAALEKLRPRKP